MAGPSGFQVSDFGSRTGADLVHWLRTVPGAKPARHPRLCGVRARGRREAMRQLPSLRRRLAAAEAALEDAHTARKHAGEAFDAADDRFTEAERALDAAREQRARARQE